MNLDSNTSDEIFDQAKKSSSSTTTDSDSSRRDRKINWTSGAADQETYRTVVINYSYGKMNQDQQKPQQVLNQNSARNLNRSQSQIQKRTEPIVNGNGTENGNGRTKRNRRTREMWKKTYVDMRDQQQQQQQPQREGSLQTMTKSESDMHLSRLYGSMQELKFEERPVHKAEVMVEPMKANRREDIVRMKPELKTIDEDCEVIVISDDEEEDQQLRAVLHNSKTTSTTSQYLTMSESKSTDMSEKLLPLDSMENIEEKIQMKILLPSSQSHKSTGTSCSKNSKNAKTSTSSQKLKVKVQPTNNYKQRQLELHHARILVEQKRLELLEVKLARERDEMMREQVLFEKELELKSSQLRQFTEDRV